MHFALDDQIASQPDAVRQLLARDEWPKLDPDRPILFAGIGTSLHACRIAAAWTAQLSGGALRPHALHAFDLAMDTPITSRDQVVIVTHRGTKRFPNAALARARAVGARTVLVTGRDAPPQPADWVIGTCADERAGTHTVSYVTALAALGSLIATLLGGTAEAEMRGALAAAPGAIEAILAQPAPIESAQRLLAAEPILVTGVGLDAITAAEAALKLKEGTYIWAEGMPIEEALHGPPAAIRAGMGLLALLPEGDDGGRTAALVGLARELGAVVVSCGTGQADLSFPPLPPLARPLVSIVPVQRLVAELARLRGSNPDRIHADLEPWAAAMGRVAL